VTGLEVLQAIAAGELPGAPFGELLGIEPVEAEEGRVVFAAVPERGHENPLGTVHGGLAATLLDSAMGCAVHSTLPAGVGSGGLRPPSSASRPTPRLLS
jgi:acyl-coenzyme A thioesterase PaaI-like protein